MIGTVGVESRSREYAKNFRSTPPAETAAEGGAAIGAMGAPHAPPREGDVLRRRFDTSDFPLSRLRREKPIGIANDFFIGLLNNSKAIAARRRHMVEPRHLI